MSDTQKQTEYSFVRLIALSSFLLLLIVLSVNLFTAQGRQVSAVAAILPPSPFDNLQLQAKSAVVYDVNSDKILFAKNPNAQLPLASITKLMTATVANSLLPSNKKVIPFAGKLWTKKDALAFMLITSSNELANELASFLEKEKNIDFVSQMNKFALQLNLKQSYFINPSGLDESDFQPGAVGSAVDVVKLFLIALAEIPEVLENTAYEKMPFTNEDLKLEAINTNKALSDMPGFVAGKTGYTDLAGGNLVVAFDLGLGHRYVAVVLGSTKQGRFEDMIKLINATYDYVKKDRIDF